MINKLLLFCLLIIIFYSIFRIRKSAPTSTLLVRPIKIKENYINIMEFNNIFLNLKNKIRTDLTIPYISNLSLIRSKFLFNYLFNYSNNIHYKNYMNKTLNEYLNSICFVSDYELNDAIMEKINDLLINYYKSNTEIDKSILVKDYINLVKKNMKLQFMNELLKNINYSLNFLNNQLIVDSILNILFDIQNIDILQQNIKDAIIYNFDGLRFEFNNKDNTNISDNLDILFEGIDQTIIKYINNNFNCNYSSILNLSLYDVKNLIYSGEILNFNFNMYFCK